MNSYSSLINDSILNDSWCIISLLHTKTKKAIHEWPDRITDFKSWTFGYLSKWVHQRMTEVHVMIYKSIVILAEFIHSIKCSKPILMMPASYWQTLTLCTRVCACLFYSIFFASVGNARTKKSQPRGGWAAVGKGSWGELLRSWVTARQIFMNHIFLPILASIMLKFRIVSNKTNLYPV